MKPKTFIFVGMVCALIGLLSCRSMNENAQSARYPLLRSLQGTINTDEPKELLAIVAAEDPSRRENPKEIPPWERLAFPLKHEALMRLLEMQRDRFSNKTFRPTGGGTGIDHIAVWVKESREDKIVIVATPSWKPTSKDDTGAEYYELETLEFSRDGRLTSRSVYIE